MEFEWEETPEVVSEVEEPVVLPCDEEPGIEESFETLDLQPELEEPAGTPDAEAGTPELELEEATEPETGTVPSPVVDETLSAPPEELPPIPTPVEPKEILEPIDFGEPEIVIESAMSQTISNTRPPVPRIPVDSPFEAEEDDEDEEAIEVEGLDSVFEFDGEVDEEDEELLVVTSPEDPSSKGAVAEPEPARLLPPPLPGSIPDAFFEEDDGSDEEVEAGSFFEFDEEEAQDEEDEEEEERTKLPAASEKPDSVESSNGVQETILFEMPLDPAPVPFARREEAPPAPKPSAEEDAARDLVEMIDEEEEESEIRSSGPFYF